jgi:S1-C subfamily serine protease
VNLTVLRGGKQESFKVVVGNLAQIFPDRFGGPADREPIKPESTKVSFGMSIENVSEQWRESHGLKQSGGIRIVEVEPNSFAEDVGLRQNDVLTDINQMPINSTDDVAKVQSTLKAGDAVAFRVLRRDPRGGGWTASFLAGALPASR